MSVLTDNHTIGVPMLMTCRCGVKLYIRYYPDKTTTLKVVCPECRLSQKIRIDLGSDAEASARALKRMRKAKAALDALSSEEVINEIQEMFDMLQLPTVWSSDEMRSRSGAHVMHDDLDKPDDDY